MRLLVPSVTDTTVDAAYAAPLGGPVGDRPWVQLCMVASLDGSTVVDGASGALSSPNDQAVLLRLRALAQVVLVGAGTAAGEGYGPPSTPGQRIAVVTRSGRLDLDNDLFRSGAAIIVTTTSTDLPDGAADVDVIRAGDSEVDLAEALRRLRAEIDVEVVQAEGGPMLNGALAAADLIDELALTVSPGVVGGDGPRLVRGVNDVERPFDLAQLAVDDEQFLFQRWVRRR
ncbi:MAG: dihydrofolate reductase family protein [Actinomycetota bacterium]